MGEMMSDLERFNELVDDIWEMVFGTKRRPEKETRMTRKEKPKRKRARKADGTYRGDDKSTPDVNEAWENE
tara:strand:- start:304 stop:516 length:213 start_codon:yes stop_codon:yes gene_type:complete